MSEILCVHLCTYGFKYVVLCVIMRKYLYINIHICSVHVYSCEPLANRCVWVCICWQWLSMCAGLPEGISLFSGWGVTVKENEERQAVHLDITLHCPGLWVSGKWGCVCVWIVVVSALLFIVCWGYHKLLPSDHYAAALCICTRSVFGDLSMHLCMCVWHVVE